MTRMLLVVVHTQRNMLLLSRKHGRIQILVLHVAVKIPKTKFAIPKTRSDPRRHRVYFREKRCEDITDGDGDLPGMFELGLQKFGCDFHLSLQTMMALIPFQVRKAGRRHACVYIT